MMKIYDDNGSSDLTEMQRILRGDEKCGKRTTEKLNVAFTTRIWNASSIYADFHANRTTIRDTTRVKAPSISREHTCGFVVRSASLAVNAFSIPSRKRTDIAYNIWRCGSNIKLTFSHAVPWK